MDELTAKVSIPHVALARAPHQMLFILGKLRFEGRLQAHTHQAIYEGIRNVREVHESRVGYRSFCADVAYRKLYTGSEQLVIHAHPAKTGSA